MTRTTDVHRYTCTRSNQLELPLLMYTYTISTPITQFDKKSQRTIVMQADLQAYAESTIGGRTLMRLEGLGRVCLHGVSAEYKSLPDLDLCTETRHVLITMHYTILDARLNLMIALGQSPQQVLEL